MVLTHLPPAVGEIKLDILAGEAVNIKDKSTKRAPDCLKPEHVVGLALADDITWGISAANRPASVILSGLEEVMQLRHYDYHDRRLIISVKEKGIRWNSITTPDGKVVLCNVNPGHNVKIRAIQLMRISWVIGLDSETRGGVLLHGALAESEGYGVILAGPGGVGKSTASRRLPEPWRPLSDDATLVVRDKQGVYWAHPWPTWSTFWSGSRGGTWDVHHAVPLQGIFFLGQDRQNWIEPVGAGKAACLLLESAEQASSPVLLRMTEDKIQTLRLQRLDNISALAKAIPCYHLRISLFGAFWKEIEHAKIR